MENTAPGWELLKVYDPGFWEAYMGRAGLFMTVLGLVAMLDWG